MAGIVASATPGPQNRAFAEAAEVLRKLCKLDAAISIGPAKPSRQLSLCNCYSGCGEDGAFQDDGEATIWFKPVDPGEQERTDEDDQRDMEGG